MKLLSFLPLLPLTIASPINLFHTNKTNLADTKNIPFPPSHPAKPIPQPRSQNPRSDADAYESDISLSTPQSALTPPNDAPISIDVALAENGGGVWVGDGNRDGTVGEEGRWTRFRRFLGRYS